MNFDINSLKTLLKTGALEVQDGVMLVSDHNQLSPKIYMKDEDLIIEFEAPFLYLHIEKLGVKKLLNLINPRVESITITDKSYDVKISTLGTWKFAKD